MPSLDRHSTLLPSLAFALSQIVLYLQALACFATRADYSIRTYYLRVFPLSLEHMGARRPGQATAIPPRLVYGVSGPQTQPLSNSVERCCWTEPNLDAAHLSNPLGSALGCRPGITPIRLRASRALDRLARPARRRLELQRLNAVCCFPCRRQKIAVLGHPSFLFGSFAHLLLQVAEAGWHVLTDNPAAQHKTLL